MRCGTDRQIEAVATFPTRMRYFLHRDSMLLGRVRRCVLRAIEAALQRYCPNAPRDSRFGAIRFVQRLAAVLGDAAVALMHPGTGANAPPAEALALPGANSAGKTTLMPAPQLLLFDEISLSLALADRGRVLSCGEVGLPGTPADVANQPRLRALYDGGN